MSDRQEVLGSRERVRYARQIMLPDLGLEGQARLRASRVVVAGVGGLGCAAATYLACAGVGHIVLVDHETVELSNLNRQSLHWESDVGTKKVTSAAEKLRSLNPSVEVVVLDARITADNARDLIRGANAVIDGMDNYEARSAVNRAAVLEGVPFVHGGVWGFNGQVTTIVPGESPCFACVYPEKPEEHSPVPVLGVTPGLIGTLQAMEAIKLLTGIGRPLTGRMLMVNLTTFDFAFRVLARNPECRACGAAEGGAQ